MVIKGFLFILLAFGLTFAVGFLVAAIIKLIAVILNRGSKASSNAGK